MPILPKRVGKKKGCLIPFLNSLFNQCMICLLHGCLLPNINHHRLRINSISCLTQDCFFLMKMNVNLGKSLLHAANLSLPTFQVVGVKANLGCAHCRDRVTQVISKMAGSNKFTVDICRKQVIVKGDFRLGCEEASRNDVKTKKKQTEGSSILRILFRFFSKPFGAFRSY